MILKLCLIVFTALEHCPYSLCYYFISGSFKADMFSGFQFFN